jgi:hypothetical protein
MFPNFGKLAIRSTEYCRIKAEFGRRALICKKLPAGSLFATRNSGGTTVQGGRSLVAAAEEVILVLVGLPPLSVGSVSWRKALLG